jgi:hypothetical protein
VTDKYVKTMRECAHNCLEGHQEEGVAGFAGSLKRDEGHSAIATIPLFN